MTTLGQITQATRKFLAICAMILVGMVLLFGVVKLFLVIKEAIFPTPPTPPTVLFGKLPSLVFPPNTTTLTFTYALNTVSGSLPMLPDRATVYKIATTQPNLLSLQKITSQVANIGFTDKPTPLTDTTYSWTNTDPLAKTLTMNILTQDFSLTSSYARDKTVIAAQNIPDQTQAIDIASMYLKKLEVFPDDINNTKTKVSLFSLSDGQLTPATSLSNAQIVRVDFFQNDMNMLPIFYATPSYSSMYLLIASAASDTQIVAGNFLHREISANSATYPIKTALAALKDLQNG